MNETLMKAYNQIRSIEPEYEKLILKLRGKNRVLASPCWFIPPEIPAALGIITLKIPEFILNRGDFHELAASIYDSVIIPGEDCFCGLNSLESPDRYIFRSPEGYGEDAAVSLHNEMAGMLRTLFDIDIKSIDLENLKKATSDYEKLRRMMRSIFSLRRENKKLLKNEELNLAMETALILPPESALSYIEPIFDELNGNQNKRREGEFYGMIYGGKSVPAAIADFIEDSGINLSEDDSCTGRRSFDISLNYDSDYIFYEILDAYSYRPLTPCIRDVRERYELLYRLLKNYDIETVIFYEDRKCSDSFKDIEYLRIRMMREGIDPLVINDDNYRDVIAEYISRR